MKKITTSALLLTSLLALASCGGGGGGGGGAKSEFSPSGIPQTTQTDEVQMPEGNLAIEFDQKASYLAVLTPTNSVIARDISGNVNINREEQSLVAYVRFAGGDKEIGHTQRIHVGTACPTLEQDANGDGIIDINEAMDFVGPVLIPLDGDLSTQDRGSSVYPVSDIYGNYWWEDVVTFDRFLADLRDQDFDLEDDIVKLGEDKSFDLEGRVVLIHGVKAETLLPSTVTTRGRLANHQTVPVACGILKRVTEIPGSYEDDPTAPIDPNAPTNPYDGANLPVCEQPTDFRWPWDNREPSLNCQTTPPPAPAPGDAPAPLPTPSGGNYGEDNN